MFARRIRLIGILYVIASVCSLTPPLRAEPRKFQIDSYIPEKFTDLRWTVGGSTSLQSSSSTRDYNDDGMNRSWSSTQQLTANSSYQRRYISVPKFLTFQVDVQGTYARTPGGETNHRTIDQIGYDTRSDRNDSYSSLTTSARPRCDAGLYVWNDWFVSATSYGSFSYTGGPTRDQKTDYRMQFVHYNDTVEINSGHLTSESGGNYRSNSVAGEFLPGFGRVYEGNYAATSLYIVDELRKLGLLTREPSTDQMRKLTDLVYDYRLRHSADKRILQIEALTAITELLRREGICDTLGPAGYLATQDVWYYYPMQSRQFGWRVRSGLGGTYSYVSRNVSSASEGYDTTIVYWLEDPSTADTTTDHNLSSSYSHSASKTSQIYWLTMLEYFRPLALKWQWNVQGQVQFYLDEWTQSGVYRTAYQHHSRSSLTTSVQYIPDSRTSAYLRLSSSYEAYRDRSYLHTDEIDNSWAIRFSPDRHSFSAGLSGNLTYRIAIPTSLSIDGSWSYNEEENLNSDFDGHARRFQLTAGINHYIF